ncbi:hypothetical protein PVK06_016407 [Gossypium arboreum]|uniref:Uncharacterized protein n=1 Tax=Gossypium arboreum TaxID=29729 RepID=A0ABR0PZX3_GOSAR|nr:hypothetical protein PVK06_016407 [Gossypium arboreum]
MYAESEERSPFKNRTLPYFENFSVIYGKYHAIGNDAQTTNDIIEELEENLMIMVEQRTMQMIGVGEDGMIGTENVEYEMILKTMASQGPHLLAKAKLEGLKKLERVK